MAEPTAVQSASLQAVLEGRDLWVCAPTGSGKTLAYALPLLQRLQSPAPLGARGAHCVRVLVLVPTRELALQVFEVLRELARDLPVPVKVNTVFGGVSLQAQLRALRGGTDIMVATPGRLLDVMARHALPLDRVQSLVLDEADRLLEHGFSEEVQAIVARVPQPGQRLFLSATFAPALDALASSLLHQPLRVELSEAPTLQADIAQSAFLVDAGMRTRLLRQLLAQHAWSRTLVFVATQFAAEIVADKLRKTGVRAEPLHGRLSQGKRSQVLADFKAGRIGVVVATDLAARGIDIAELPAVVNYDLPRSAQDYTHRIGRTARAGLAGEAVSLVTPAMRAHWTLISKRHGLDVALAIAPGFEPAPDATTVAASLAAPLGAAPADPHGGRKGLRPSKKDKLRAAAALAAAAQAV